MKNKDINNDAQMSVDIDTQIDMYNGPAYTFEEYTRPDDEKLRYELALYAELYCEVCN